MPALPSSKPKSPLGGRPPIVLTVLGTIVIFLTGISLLNPVPISSYIALSHLTCTTKQNNQSSSISAKPVVNIKQLQQDFHLWLDHLKATGPSGRVTTERLACYEHEAKAQTCSFEGMICADVRNKSLDGLRHSEFFFVDDRKEDNSQIPTDNWCGMRHQSSDPRYYFSRTWPILENTVLPQQSCLHAVYRTASSLFAGNPRVKWVQSLAVIDYDFLENDHNGHLASDTLWMLDALLFQDSLALNPQRPGYSAPDENEKGGGADDLLLAANFTIFVPQSREQFQLQMSRDINRLLYGLILRANVRNLYSNLSDDELHRAPAANDSKRWTEPIFSTFPELDSGRLMFNSDLIRDDSTDLVCTPRLTAGYKTGFAIDERTCREIRTKSFELYGIERPPMTHVGQIFFPQPPKSVLIIDRHLNRRIANAAELVEGLKAKLEPRGVNVTYMKTDKLETAEEFVRVYSSAGIVISPHGSQNMAQMWMQRYA